MSAFVPIKGLLIDPENQTITEVEVTPDKNGETHLDSIYDHLNCTCVDVGRYLLEYLPSNPKDDIWFDDEGNYSNCPYMFLLPGYVPLIGRGLILSHDDSDGRSLSHSLSSADIEFLRKTVRWFKREVN